MTNTPIRITLSGDLGSGKSSVGKRIAETLGVPYYSAGALFRDIGRIDNLDALKTNLAAENNTAIDFAVDAKTREIDETVPSFVIDSRMAWHFVKNATKVFLAVSRDTAAHRILADGSRATETYEDHRAAVQALLERRQSETKRYRQLYDVDITDPANYDLVVVTDDAAVDAVADLVLSAARGDRNGKFWLPRSRLVPMVPFDDGKAMEPAGPLLPLTVIHNFGFYAGDPGALAGCLAAPGAFVPYLPAPAPADADAFVAEAKRVLTPGGLGRWHDRYQVGGTFLDVSTPARP